MGVIFHSYSSYRDKYKPECCNKNNHKPISNDWPINPSPFAINSIYTCNIVSVNAIRNYYMCTLVNGLGFGQLYPVYKEEADDNETFQKQKVSLWKEANKNQTC